VTNTEKWNLIVSKYEENLGAVENVIESIWTSIFTEIFGYSKLLGEIESQRFVSVAHTNVKIDLIVKSGGKDFFIFELKRHNTPFSEKDEKQLFDYIKLLDDVKIGVLICNKIYIYVDYIKLEIPFSLNNCDGIKFVEFFSKNSFSEESIRKWVISKKEFEQNVKSISQKITPELIRGLLREHFIQQYSLEEVEKAITVTKIKDEIDIEPKQAFAKPNILKINTSEQKRSQRIKRAGLRNICSKFGFIVPDGFQYANKLKDDKYRVDIFFERSNESFCLILSNEEIKVIYIFEIAPNAIPTGNLLINTHNTRYKLVFDDVESGFRENRSGVKIDKYLIKTIKY